MGRVSETGAATSEIKFLVRPEVASLIHEWTRTWFEPDPHGAGLHGDEYETTTLYFDTAQLDVFHRRGSYGRAKYRVRRYGSGGRIFLERKLRKPGLLIKRRTMGSIDALSLLEKADVLHEWDGQWFHRRLLLRRLRPVCQVSYRRVARTLDGPDGVARLTLDADLRVRATEAARFIYAATTPFLESHVILEMKYGAHLPAVCRRLVEEFALSPHTASKYRLGMAALSRSALQVRPWLLAEAGVLHA